MPPSVCSKTKSIQTVLYTDMRRRQAVATAHPCSCRCDREDYIKDKDAICDKDYMSQRITRLRMYATKRIRYNMNYTSHNQHLSPRDTSDQWSSHQIHDLWSGIATKPRSHKWAKHCRCESTADNRSIGLGKLRAHATAKGRQYTLLQSSAFVF